jgi:hypothetical protein
MMKLPSKMGVFMMAAACTYVGANASAVSWQADFRVTRDRLVAGPGNAYFPLTPKQTLVYKNGACEATISFV